MHVVLVEPEIPQNTGNIARTCVMTNSTLHLIGKLGFSLDDRYVRRAGLDYWSYLTYFHYNDLDSLYSFYPGKNFYYFTTRAERSYAEISYKRDDFLVFGKETAGLPQEIVDTCKDYCMRIPMAEGIPRSLNLANSVALVLYEALRQQDFPLMR